MHSPLIRMALIDNTLFCARARTRTARTAPPQSTPTPPVPPPAFFFRIQQTYLLLDMSTTVDGRRSTVINTSQMVDQLET